MSLQSDLELLIAHCAEKECTFEIRYFPALKLEFSVQVDGYKRMGKGTTLEAAVAESVSNLKLIPDRPLDVQDATL
jgi:hypothetical protein